MLENLSLAILITSKCNKRCAHCSVSQILNHEQHLDFEQFKKRFFELTILDLKNVQLPPIEQLKLFAEKQGKSLKQLMNELLSKLRKETNQKRKLKEIIIAGGEPTLHPDFKKFVLFASRAAETVQIDTNLTTMPQTEKEIEEHLNWLPKNATFMIGFDDYHYPKLNSEFEIKLLNFIKYCIKTKKRLVINVVSPKKEIPLVQNPKLKEYLEELAKKPRDDAQILDFRGKPERVGYAQKLPKKDTRPISEYRLHRRLISNKSMVLFPDLKMYASESATLFPLTENNIFYLGRLDREPMELVYDRYIHKVYTQFGKPIDPKKEADAQRKITEEHKNASPAFIAFLRRMTNYNTQKKLREHTLNRLRTVLRPK